MTTDLLIHNVQVLRPGQGTVGRSLLVCRSRIAAIDPAPAQLPPHLTRLDGGGRLLTPGLIDLHIHGTMMKLFEADARQLLDAAACLPRFGVTCVLPTLYRQLDRHTLPKLRELSEAMDRWPDQRGARMPGFHMEGPFLARAGAGGLTYDGDLDRLRQLLDTAGPRVAAMSIAPDTRNIIPVIEHLAAANIKVLITHTAANVAQTEAAIDAGASHATHFYDVFHLPGRADAGIRPVGAVEVILGDERVSVDFIADGVHVHPAAIRAALAAKGPDKVLLITDANVVAGLKPGLYHSPCGSVLRSGPTLGARVHAPGTDRHHILSGSALTMNVGIANLKCWLKLPEHHIWAMGSRNVAQRMGLTGLGDIVEGHAADLVLWDHDEAGVPQPAQTWVDGRSVYQRGDDSPPGTRVEPLNEDLITN
jgi:N-acetylglucosamine-6-phosphate deacetylase